MEYKLYTLVDVSHTGQYRTVSGQEEDRWKEQNFQTMLQTIGIRGNITYGSRPMQTTVAGSVVGFDTEDIIQVWRFDFNTERDNLFEVDGDPVGLLKSDFHLVPYISGLSEQMTQNYAVFNTANPGANIVFYKK
jgi:hypothetical protein